MDRLGYLLKCTAVAIGMINCVLLGEQLAQPHSIFWPATFASAGVIPVLLYFGYKLQPAAPPIKKQIRTHPGVRDYAPIPGEGWLPHEAWREFPDPLPEIPAVHVSFSSDIPAGDVPPDATLRRLWLVRAQIALDYNAHRRFARFHYRRPVTTFKLAVLWVIGAAMLVFDEGQLGPRLAGLFVVLSLTWPIFVGAKGCIEQTKIIRSRSDALRVEELRLMERDSQRPGGPLGGESVTKDWVRPAYAGPSYTPPLIPSDSLT